MTRYKHKHKFISDTHQPFSRSSSGNPGRLVGQRFGRLRVTCKIRRSNQWRWRCFCDCGADVAVSTRDLTTGKVQSCERCAHAPDPGRTA